MGILRREFLAGGAAAAGIAVSRIAEARPRRRVRMGVNYVPSRYWWYSWGEWHPDSIRRDLEDIAALGFDHIRIQLIWPDFQPNASYVSEEKTERLTQFLDIADAFALDVEVTVLDGQLSGFLFVPSWLIDDQTGKVRDFITDPGLIEAQHLLFDTLGRRIGDHRRFLGFDIANEIYWATIPLGLSVSTAQGDAWMRSLLRTCERVAPGKMHVNGVDKYPLEDDEQHVFSRPALATAGAASVTHPWEGFGAVPGGLFAQFGPRSTQATHYGEFLVQYLQAFADDPHRPVWIEEFGCSKQWVEVASIPDWADASIRNTAGCENVFGLTWWCSHDPNRRFSGMNTLEYDLGLYTNDRVLKPIGARLRDLIASFDASPPEVIARREAMVIPDNAGANGVMDRYMRLIDSGTRAKIVLKSRSTDREYLRSRGIDRVIDIAEIV
jgi:hypothetical protein